MYNLYFKSIMNLSQGEIYILFVRKFVSRKNSLTLEIYAPELEAVSRVSKSLTSNCCSSRSASWKDSMKSVSPNSG